MRLLSPLGVPAVERSIYDTKYQKPEIWVPDYPSDNPIDSVRRNRSGTKKRETLAFIRKRHRDSHACCGGPACSLRSLFTLQRSRPLPTKPLLLIVDGVDGRWNEQLQVGASPSLFNHPYVNQNDVSTSTEGFSLIKYVEAIRDHSSKSAQRGWIGAAA